MAIACLFAVVMFSITKPTPERVNAKDKFVEATEISYEQIMTMNDVDKQDKPKLLKTMASNEQIAYINNDKAYLILRLDTEMGVELTEILKNEIRQEVKIAYELTEEPMENTGTFVYKLLGLDGKYVSLSSDTVNSLDGIRNIVAINNGNKFEFIDCATNKNIDVEYTNWYGNGVYSAVLEKQDNGKYKIVQSERLNSCSLEALIVEPEENYDGLIEVLIGSGTELFVESKNEDTLLRNMKYIVELIYDSESNEFEIIAKDIVFKPQRNTTEGVYMSEE